MTLAIHRSSARTGTGRDDWETPPEILDLVRGVSPVALDPCAARKQDTPSCVALDRGGLEASWASCVGDRDGLVYVNPPYSQLRQWLMKCADESHAESTLEIVALIPARTDTRAWHGSVSTADAVCFWRGRITFVGAQHPAPFPSALIYWGPRRYAFADAFAARGLIWMP